MLLLLFHTLNIYGGKDETELWEKLLFHFIIYAYVKDLSRIPKIFDVRTFFLFTFGWWLYQISKLLNGCQGLKGRTVSKSFASIEMNSSPPNSSSSELN